jgi:hypothetical protein
VQWMFVHFMAVWSIIRPFGIFYGHLVYSIVIWYIFTHFDTCPMKNLATQRLTAQFFPVLVFCAKKNLAIPSSYEAGKHLHVCMYDALAAWRSGHRIHLRNRKPGFESRKS